MGIWAWGFVPACDIDLLALRHAVGVRWGRVPTSQRAGGRGKTSPCWGAPGPRPQAQPCWRRLSPPLSYQQRPDFFCLTFMFRVKENCQTSYKRRLFLTAQRGVGSQGQSSRSPHPAGHLPRVRPRPPHPVCLQQADCPGKQPLFSTHSAPSCPPPPLHLPAPPFVSM